MDKKLKNLRFFNLVMGCFHVIQGYLMLSLSNDFSLPVNTSFLKFDVLTKQLAPRTEEIIQLKIGPLIAGFLFLSAFAHFAISVFPSINKWYNENIKKGINPARWVEYSASSSLMIVVIAMLVGVYDGPALILMFFMNMMMILFGWVMEVHNQTTQKTNWISYVFGCIAGIIPWLVIALFLAFSGEGEFKAPDFVYWIFFSMFLFFNVFAINMVLQYKKVGPWKDYIFGERIYIILSLVAKSLLAWQVFAGTLRPM
jgi:hypothetical protein